MWTPAASFVAAVLVAGCGIGGGPAPIPADCQFPQDVELSYAGDTTLGAVGLAAPGGESLPARVWITAAPIMFEAAGTTTRVICAQVDDGSVMLSPYPVEEGPNDGGIGGRLISRAAGDMTRRPGSGPRLSDRRPAALSARTRLV